jgi:hypothetical protein
MVTWLAWLSIALALLVTAINLWIMWVQFSAASRRPAEPGPPAEHPLERRSEAEHEPHILLEQLDERGYLSSRKLRMGCAAALCKTPFGARIVAGKNGLEEPQYAWDYTSVRQAKEALLDTRFRTEQKKGIVVSEGGSGFYPVTEPRNYFRRWKYTADGQMKRF